MLPLLEDFPSRLAARAVLAVEQCVGLRGYPGSFAILDLREDFLQRAWTWVASRVSSAFGHLKSRFQDQLVYL